MSVILQSGVTFEFVTGQLQMHVDDKILSVINGERLIVYDSKSKIPKDLKLINTREEPLTGVTTCNYRDSGDNLHSFFRPLRSQSSSRTNKSERKAGHNNKIGSTIVDCVEVSKVEEPDQIISL